LEFRKRYALYTKEAKGIVKKDEKVFLSSLNEPCQVVVIDFVEPYGKAFIILHSEEHPDMEIAVLENMTSKDFSDEVLKEMKLLESLDKEEIQILTKSIESYAIKDSESKSEWEWSHTDFKKSTLVVFRYDPRLSTKRYEFGELIDVNVRVELYETLREKQRKKIEEALGVLRSDAKEIPEGELRTKIMEATARLERHMNQLDKKHEKLRDELVGVRRLVGTETFGEWRVLLSEIDKTNTRIDALSDIRNAYDKVLAQQNVFMEQQADVMKQQASFVKWIKYATILVPIAVVSVPIIEILLHHFLGIS